MADDPVTTAIAKPAWAPINEREAAMTQVAETAERGFEYARANNLFGMWCFDCGEPALAPTYAEACVAAEAAGWRMIRGVNRCAACAHADGTKEAAGGR